jgi:hypothetical protein
MSSMDGLRKETNPDGDCRWSYRYLVGHDQGTPLMEQRRLGHHTVCSPLRTLARTSSRDVVPSETDSQ